MEHTHREGTHQGRAAKSEEEHPVKEGTHTHTGRAAKSEEAQPARTATALPTAALPTGQPPPSQSSVEEPARTAAALPTGSGAPDWVGRGEWRAGPAPEGCYWVDEYRQLRWLDDMWNGRGPALDASVSASALARHCLDRVLVNSSTATAPPPPEWDPGPAWSLTQPVP